MNFFKPPSVSRLEPLNKRLFLCFMGSKMYAQTSSLHFALPAGPGISSYASAPWKAGESLKACLHEAESRVPGKRHHETPLYLGATAGMRLLEYGTLLHIHFLQYIILSPLPPSLCYCLCTQNAVFSAAQL